MNKIIEVLLTTLLFCLVLFIYKDQKRNTLNGGKGYDGTEYYKTVEQYNQGKVIVVGSKPFIKRIGTPYLISLYSKNMRNNILDSAESINLIAAYLISILLVFWLAFYVKWFWLRIFINILYMLGWMNALRYSFFYPMNSDSWGVVFLLIGLILIHNIKEYYHKDEKRKYLLLIILLSFDTFLGIFFRESNFVLAFALLFIVNPFHYDFKKVFNLQYNIASIRNFMRNYRKKTSFFLFIPLFFCILANVVVSKLILPIDNGYSYIFTTLSFIYKKTLPEYFLAIFNAYGPFFILVLFYYKAWIHFFKQRQELFFLMLASFVLGFIGGSGSERILFNLGFPIVFILIAESIFKIYNTEKKWWFFVILLLQVVAYRVFWFTPDYDNPVKMKLIPFFTLLGNKFDFLLLFSSYGKELQNVVLFLEYCFLILITGFVLNNSIFNIIKNLTKKKFNDLFS